MSKIQPTSPSNLLSRTSRSLFRELTNKLMHTAMPHGSLIGKVKLGNVLKKNA